MSENLSKCLSAQNLCKNFKILNPWTAIAAEPLNPQEISAFMGEWISESLQEQSPLLLSAATGAVLGGLWCGNQLQLALQAIGEQSEELFRGEQLPFLKFPHNEV